MENENTCFCYFTAMNILPVFIVCLSVISMQSRSQDCKLQKTTDDFSGQPKLSTGFVDLQGVKLSIDATSREIDYFFVINNPMANCIGDRSEAIFTFEGGKQKMELKNTGGDNCNGFFHIILRSGQYTPTAMNRLAAKKVETISFSDRNGKLTHITLTPQQQELLMKLTDCVAKEVKQLPR